MRPKKAGSVSAKPRVPTHKELVNKASAWLKTRGYKLVVTEAVTHAQEIPDAIGWKNGKWSALVECKVTRADFKRDADKPSRKDPKKRLGQLRYYLAPQGVIPLEDVPEGWGLIELVSRSLVVTKPAPKEPYSTLIAANELLILTHLLRRAEIRGLKLSETWGEMIKARAKGRKDRTIELGPEDYIDEIY